VPLEIPAIVPWSKPECRAIICPGLISFVVDMAGVQAAGCFDLIVSIVLLVLAPDPNPAAVTEAMQQYLSELQPWACNGAQGVLDSVGPILLANYGTVLCLPPVDCDIF